MATFVYFWINDVEVNKIDVVFTVIVGWLGLIIGAFFGQKFMDNLTVKELKRVGIPSYGYIKRYKRRINNLLKIIEDYKEIKLKK